MTEPNPDLNVYAEQLGLTKDEAFKALSLGAVALVWRIEHEDLVDLYRIKSRGRS